MWKNSRKYSLCIYLTALAWGYNMVMSKIECPECKEKFKADRSGALCNICPKCGKSMICNQCGSKLEFQETGKEYEDYCECENEHTCGMCD